MIAISELPVTRGTLINFGINMEKVGSRWMVPEGEWQRFEAMRLADHKTGWRQKGRRLKADATPIGEMRYGHWPHKSWCDLYTIDQTEPIQKKTAKRAIAGDITNPQEVLAAIFAVNRSAKRYRDAASNCYLRNAFTFATAAKEKKEENYRLKDKGIVYAFHQGWIQPETLHGEFVVYRGSGYCFHSLLTPNDWVGSDSDQTGKAVFIEAKPRTTKEMRLKDAIATLEQLPDDESEFQRVSKSRQREDDQFEAEYEQDYDNDYAFHNVDEQPFWEDYVR